MKGLGAEAEDGATPYTGAIVDAFVQHNWASQDELASYLSREWQQYLHPFANYTARLFPIQRPYGNPSGNYLAGSGDRPGSNFELVRKLLDNSKVERAVLCYDEAIHIPAIQNKRLAVEVARAANDWCIDRWLNGKDDRLYSLVVVANQSAVEAVDEIRRVGHHPRMVGVLMGTNGLGTGFGHPAYHPIYEAAAELGLPIVFHAAGDSSQNTMTHVTAGGRPLTHLEYRTLISQSVANHVLNLIAEGVFDKYPGLRVLIVGAGAAWAPPWILRIEHKMYVHAAEIPWAHETPIKYFHNHIRLTTYPIDASGKDEKLLAVLRMVPDVERLLCYASGFPSWDTNSVSVTAKVLPQEWHSAVFAENILGWLRFPSPSVGTTGRQVAYPRGGSER